MNDPPRIILYKIAKQLHINSKPKKWQTENNERISKRTCKYSMYFVFFILLCILLEIDIFKGLNRYLKIIKNNHLYTI